MNMSRSSENGSYFLAVVFRNKLAKFGAGVGVSLIRPFPFRVDTGVPLIALVLLSPLPELTGNPARSL